MSAIVNKAYLEYRDRWIEDEIEKDGGRDEQRLRRRQTRKIKRETVERERKRAMGVKEDETNKRRSRRKKERKKEKKKKEKRKEREKQEE